MTAEAPSRADDAAAAPMLARPVIDRLATQPLLRMLTQEKCVVLYGPYEVGKTHLAGAVANLDGGAQFFRASRPEDRTKLLGDSGLIANGGGALIIIDDIQMSPDCVSAIRDEMERAERGERAVGRFLLLGSSMRETAGMVEPMLAARVQRFDLGCLTVDDLRPSLQESAAFVAEASNEMATEPAVDLDISGAVTEEGLWLRGGFPGSLLAMDDAESFLWRERYVARLATRCAGPWNASASVVHQFLERMAIEHGSTLSGVNLAKLPNEMRPLVGHALDLGLIRHLPRWATKRAYQLGKDGRYYLRDSGLLHWLRGMRSLDDVRADAMFHGASWEGFCIEALAQAAHGAPLSFYREDEKDEIDLVIEIARGVYWAIEIKGGGADARPGFRRAAGAIEAKQRIVVRKIDAATTRGDATIMPLRLAVAAVRAAKAA